MDKDIGQSFILSREGKNTGVFERRERRKAYCSRGCERRSTLFHDRLRRSSLLQRREASLRASLQRRKNLQQNRALRRLRR